MVQSSTKNGSPQTTTKSVEMEVNRQKLKRKTEKKVDDPHKERNRKWLKITTSPAKQ